MAINQLSDGNPDGTLLGQSPTDDKIAFYAATPIVQQVLPAGAPPAQIVDFLTLIGLSRKT